MTASDFRAWCEAMRATRGWSDAEIARQLDCGENQVRIWKAKGTRRYIALACAALAHPIPAWTAPRPS